jgi:two-component system LytT family response regulator
MDTMRTLIVDDEPLARRRVRTLLPDEGGVEIVGECADGSEALSAIRDRRPNLLFLDLQLPDLDGFTLLQSVAPDAMPAVIFMTTFDRQALRMFEAHGVDYLLKPFDRSRLAEALAGARAQLRRGPAETWRPSFLTMLREASLRRLPVERLRVKSKGRMLLVKTDEIDWIDSEGNYALLHMGTAVHRLRERLKDLEARLDPGQFIRIHRSTIVNVDRIKEIQQGPHRDYVVGLTDGTRLAASRSYTRRLRQIAGD